MLFCLIVVGSGLWLAPGDSEEVGVALTQALRNSLERFFFILANVHYFCRRPQPTIEFTFAATEEAIYVHAVVSAKSVKFTILSF
ncbi:hypothetical protein BHM03_00013466 [Ensete ventricosum]|uniref:Mediator of RNA polymerase II transcription subunit 13 n=1 Tax=Ensete ventricosum TaxID=4639 RepID=A0A445MDZ3_ENSVE|nr:hypothetical protein BHM03_00013466 [Ensete ventricosum]